MKKRYSLLSIIVLVVFLSSCGDKEEKKPVQKETPVQEVLKPDTAAQEVVIEEEAPPMEEEQIPQDRVVTVQKGEWLYDIARREYGSMHEWRKIYEANKDNISNPDVIYPNQELIIPE